MIQVQPFGKLGQFRNEWLNARHHFNFGYYRERGRDGFGGLLVWNDDEVAPQEGFDPHPHREMEIITYVREGAITHRDSLGNEGRTSAGEIQVMHAGTGIVHSEYNLEDSPTRLFQIWIKPDRARAEPGWGMRRFPAADGHLAVLASGRATDAGSGALLLNADAALMAGALHPGETVTLSVDEGRGVYLVPATGEVTVNGQSVHTRDGAWITGETEVTIAATTDTELVLVDVRA